MSESTVHTFDDLTDRLDEIIAAVRSKDTSLERCLDLFDEAIGLGSKAVDMVDTFELSPREADSWPLRWSRMKPNRMTRWNLRERRNRVT